jgi:hypothetical protein
MPDGIQPVGAMIKPPDSNQGISSISGILGLKQQQQNLQTGALQQQQTALETGKQQAVQDFFRTWDPTQHIADDGSTDLDSALQSKEFKAAGNAKPAIMQSLLDIKNKQLGNKQALAGLNKELVTQFGTGMGTLAKDADVLEDKTDPQTGVNAGRAKIDQFLGNFGKLSPDAARIASIYGPITQHAPAGKLSHGVVAMQLQAQSASEQQGQQNPVPGAFDTGTQILPTVTNRAIGVPQLTGQAINRTQVQQLPSGALGAVTGATGDVRPLGGGPSSAAPGGIRTADMDAPPPNAPAAAQQSYLDATKQARDHVTQIRGADETYGTNVSLSNTIRKLSADTSTGPGTAVWHHALGALGAPVGADNVADYQLIGAYLDRQAALTRQQMGLPATNEGAATSQAIAGNVGYQRKALQDKNDLNQALAEGLHAYRNGLDRVEGFTGNPSPKAVQQYRSAWVNNFDPNVFRLENAQKRIKEDPQAISRLLAELSPEEAASLRQKRKNLQLLQQGQIPP